MIKCSNIKEQEKESLQIYFYSEVIHKLVIHTNFKELNLETNGVTERL